MFKRYTYDLGDSIEYEFHFAGTRGAKGEKRQPKTKPTSEAQKKINQRRKEKEMRRLIAMNFDSGDLWITMKYPKGTRKGRTEINKDWSAFCRYMRTAYRKMGVPLKYIYRIEVGKLGGIHIHMIVNRIEGTDTGLLINDCWTRARHREDPEPPKKGELNGYVEIEYLYGEGEYEKLAEYITKPPASDTGQMYFADMGMEDKKAYLKCSSSRNLKRPKPEIKTYTHTTMRKILSEGPKPKAGFYIDKDSIVQGINPYTGWSYLQYREIRLKPERGRRTG